MSAPAPPSPSRKRSGGELEEPIGIKKPKQKTPVVVITMIDPEELDDSATYVVKVSDIPEEGLTTLKEQLLLNPGMDVRTKYWPGGSVMDPEEPCGGDDLFWFIQEKALRTFKCGTAGTASDCEEDEEVVWRCMTLLHRE